MFDLHSHLPPGLNDGVPDLETSLAMARANVAQRDVCVACTSHIMPGLKRNSCPKIKKAVTLLQQHLNEAGIALRVTPGSEKHIALDFARIEARVYCPRFGFRNVARHL
jgi:protein-tyrosine phosphatase